MTLRATTAEDLARLVAAAEGLALQLERASVAHPKPRPCVAHKRLDDRPQCPNCLALYEWEMAKRAVQDGPCECDLGLRTPFNCWSCSGPVAGANR